MVLTPDMRELIRLFELHEVAYAMVGGYAVNYYGYVRATQDVDFLVLPTPDNARRVMQALADFGFGAAGIPVDYLEREHAAIHLGVEPNRIDLLTTLTGVKPAAVIEGAVRVEIDDLGVRVIDLEHLIEAKRSSGRPRDQADADELVRRHAPDQE